MADFETRQMLAQDRRKRFAEQSQYENPQGQMVGGIYVAPNPLQYLAAGLRTFGGMKGEALANQELKDLAQEKATGTKNALAEFLRQSQGTPQQTAPFEAPAFDEQDAAMMGQQGMKQITAPAVAPNMQGAFAALMNAPDAGLQQAGMQGQLSFVQKQAEQAQKAQEQARIGQLLQTMTPQQAIASGVPPEMVKSYFESKNYGRAKVEFKDVGGQLMPVTEYGDTPEGVAPMMKTGNPFSDLLVRGVDGQIVQNAPLVGAKTDIARAGKPIVNVDARNFNTQESEQSKAYGKSLGDIRSTITQAGYDANAKLSQLDRMEQLLGSLDAGGRAAPLMADVASVAESMGIKLDPNLGAKEAAQSLAIEMASNMRQPGTGPMTDKDFENFLRRVPDLSKTPSGRKQITSTMRAALERDNQAAKFARDYANANSGVIDDKFFDAIADFYKRNPVVSIPVPSTNARGQSLPKFDPAKEQRYQQWLKSQQGAQ